MAKLTSYRDLVAWQKAMDLVATVYQAAGRLPAMERFGLAVQMQRAAVSIPSNIAEGFGRSGRADYLRFLDMAVGSLNEVETQLLLSQRLGYLSDSQVQTALEESCQVQKIVKGLMRSLRRADGSGLRGASPTGDP